jgi:hypothetical protein
VESQVLFQFLCACYVIENRKHAFRPAGFRNKAIEVWERALAVGGSLRTGAAPGGGFLVAADLPAKPETP